MRRCFREPRSINMTSVKKPMTIDQYCQSPEGGHADFIKRKEEFLKTLECERKERIRAARQFARELSWTS